MYASLGLNALSGRDEWHDEYIQNHNITTKVKPSMEAYFPNISYKQSRHQPQLTANSDLFSSEQATGHYV